MQCRVVQWPRAAWQGPGRVAEALSLVLSPGAASMAQSCVSGALRAALLGPQAALTLPPHHCEAKDHFSDWALASKLAK